MRRTAMVIALILAAGCGTADPPYRPQEAPSPEAASPVEEESTSPSQEATSPARTKKAAGPETVSIGGGKLRVTIDWPADNGPLHRLMTDYYLATRKSLVAGNDRYLEGLDVELTGAKGAYDWVHDYTDADKTLKGTAKIYDLRVAAVMGKGAQVDACIDETGTQVFFAGTGKAVSPQPSWVRTPYLQVLLAHRGDDGVWRIRDYRYDMEGCT